MAQAGLVALAGLEMFSFKEPSDELERLRGWISRHRPDIQEKVSGNHPLSCLYILNNETGLDIKPNEPIQTTARMFLKALQEIEAKKDEET